MFTRSVASPCELGPLALAQAAEVVADAVVAGDEAGDGLVDQLAGRRVAPPAHRQLDGLVRHGAASGLRRPGELLRLLGEEEPLAAVDRAEQVLRHPQRLAVGEPRRPTGASRSSSSARSSARSRGSNSGRSWGRAPRAASTSAWAGLCRSPVPRAPRPPPPNDVTPPGLNGPSARSSTLRFAQAVQTLAGAARALGLVVPSFRSPPRLVGVLRSIKRWDGGATVAVVVRGRPVAGGAGRPHRGRGRRQRPRAARLRPRPRRAVARPRGAARR